MCGAEPVQLITRQVGNQATGDTDDERDRGLIHLEPMVGSSCSRHTLAPATIELRIPYSMLEPLRLRMTRWPPAVSIWEATSSWWFYLFVSAAITTPHQNCCARIDARSGISMPDRA